MIAAATDVQLPESGPQSVDAPAAEATMTLIAADLEIAPSRTEFQVDSVAQTVDFSPGEAESTEMMTSLFTPIAPSTADLDPIEMVAVEGDPFLDGMNMVDAFDQALPAMEERAERSLATFSER